jgi:hypothetical protein
LGDEAERRFAVGGLADDRDVRLLLQHRNHPGARDRVVVGDDDP